MDTETLAPEQDSIPTPSSPWLSLYQLQYSRRRRKKLNKKEKERQERKDRQKNMNKTNYIFDLCITPRLLHTCLSENISLQTKDDHHLQSVCHGT
jgi:hypothetical protein